MTWYERHPVAVVFGAIAGVVLLIFGIWALGILFLLPDKKARSGAVRSLKSSKVQG